MAIYKVTIEQLMRVWMETEVEASSEADAKAIVMARLKEEGSTGQSGDITELEHHYDEAACHAVEEVKVVA